MTSEQFLHYLAGIADAVDGAPTPEQWERVTANLRQALEAQKPSAPTSATIKASDILRRPVTAPPDGMAWLGGEET